MLKLLTDEGDDDEESEEVDSWGTARMARGS
jgi:hypothetical protein